MGFSDFIDGFVSSALGRVVAVNAVDGCGMGFYDEATLHQLLEGAYSDDLLDESALAPFKEYINKLAETASSGGWLGTASGESIVQQGGHFLVVWPAHVLTQIASQADIRRLTQLVTGLPGPGPSTDQWWERLGSLPESDRYFRLADHSGIGNRMFWFTPETTLQLQTASNAADWYRDLLGLIHHEEGQRLVVLKVPFHVLRGIPHSRPTFIEAGGHRRFMARPRSQGGLADSAYGRTVDLSKFGAAQILYDGAPERVAHAVPASEALSTEVISFEYLGAVTCTRGRAGAPDSDDAFSRALADGRTDAELAAALKRS